MTLIAAIIGWLVWPALTCWVGTSLFDAAANLGEMLRRTGFAQAPLILAIVLYPGALVGGIWVLVASPIAIRQGLAFHTSNSVSKYCSPPSQTMVTTRASGCAA